MLSVTGCRPHRSITTTFASADSNASLKDRYEKMQQLTRIFSSMRCRVGEHLLDQPEDVTNVVAYYSMLSDTIEAEG
jgi:hypothetical protein